MGNFNDDIFPEIVLVSSFNAHFTNLSLLRNDGSIIWGPVNIVPEDYYTMPSTHPCVAEQPAVLDVDNDGHPEIALNVFNEVRVYNGNGSLQWNKKVNIELGANAYATGDGRLGSVSSFDYNNDSKMDVLYQSVDTFYIFRGTDGEVLFKQALANGGPSTSLPVVADIDNDNSAEIITTGSEYVYRTYPNPTPGLRVYKDANGVWANARKIWNQKSYCKTNVNDDGTIPVRPEPSWLKNNTFGENNFDKQNGCMDLNASFLRLENPVAQDTLKLSVRIGCKGSLNAPPDLDVAFYDGTGTNKTLLAKIVINRCLQPGEYVDTGIVITDQSLRGEHTITVVADDNGTGHGKVLEPDEIDNQKTAVFYFFNHAPEIIAEQMPTGFAYKDYVFQVHASDVDGHSLKYRLMIGKVSKTEFGNYLDIDSISGIISANIWPGIYDLRVQAMDPYGAYTMQDYQLVIENGNNAAPAITSQPPLTAKVGKSYSYKIIANDPDNDPLFYKLDIDNENQTPPIGMDLGLTTGLLTWTPGEYFVSRSQLVKVIVTDRRGGIVNHNFSISVTKSTNSLPEFQSTPPNSVLQGELYSYKPNITDMDRDTVHYWLSAAPSGMKIDNSGTVVFTPGQNDVGAKSVAIKATDGIDTVCQTFTMKVINVNDPPVITSQPQTFVENNGRYEYVISAHDPDNDNLAYELLNSPSAMSVNSSGTIQWKQNLPIGTVSQVQLRVTDTHGAFTTQIWTVTVISDTVKPAVSILCEPALVYPGETSKITLKASDNAGIANAKLLVDGRDVVLDNAMQYIFHSTSEGVITLTGYATDMNGNNNFVSRQLFVSKETDNIAPVIKLNATPGSFMVGQQMTFTLNATDNVSIDSERLWLSIDGKDVPVLKNVAYYTPLTKGTHAAYASVYDAAGNVDDTLFNFYAQYTDIDSVNPVAEIISPYDTTIYNSTYISGSAIDEYFAFYTLSYRALNSTQPIEFYRSEIPVLNGILGKIDPGVMENGSYEIILKVYKKSGKSSINKSKITVDGQLKTGLFTIAFEDLGIPMPGLNLQVVRQYDSRNRLQGDFGYGWKMDLRSVQLTESCIPGDYWDIKTVSGGLLPAYKLSPLRNHIIQIAIPGGRTQCFNVEARLFSQFNPTYGEFVYTPRPGTYSKLEVLDAGAFYIMNGELYDSEGDFTETYNPKKFRLTFPDGTAYTIDQEKGGVISITEANGNYVNLSNSGITHSAGQSITFQRDSMYRITSVTDNSGREVQYLYDGLGNLQKVIDPSGAVTRFKYGPDHYLQEIIDPRGVRATRVEYDQDGRMVRQISPAGDTLAFNHDPANNREILKDFNGNETEYTYDSLGNVLAKTDAKGNTWTYSYDQYSNVISTVDPMHHTKSSTFDTKGNELTSTDELNRTTVRTYTASGKVETETDPLNRETRYIYDSKGNLTQVIGPDNTVTSEKSYDNFGNILTEKSAGGNITRYGYDSQGRMISKTDPLGRKTRFVLDSRGNTTAEVNADSDTTKYFHDAKNNQIMVVNCQGDTTRNEYNVFNKISKQIDALGNVTTFEYDIFGQLTKIIAPDSTFTEKEYDANGNVTSSFDAMGRRTSFVYDHEKRVIRTTLNDNSFTKVEYDKLGRRTASIDAKGNRTEYGYDAVGNNTVVRDAYGNETRYEYDAANRRTAMIDALNHRTEYVYDDYDRLDKNHVSRWYIQRPLSMI